jgi:hypothetical protein
MSRRIEIIVSPKGETIVQTKGFAGASCRDASRFIEQALGCLAAEHLTTEFHQPSTHNTSVQTEGLRN